MSKLLEKIYNLPFSSKDLLGSLVCYNFVFFVFWRLTHNDMKGAFLVALLVSMVFMLALMSFHLFEKKNEEEHKLLEQDEFLRKQIRDEYQKIYRLKRKTELLAKAGCLDQDEKKKLVSEMDSRLVHFFYLKRLSTTPLPRDGSESHPPGA